MTDQAPIYVDDELFWGRVAEQKQFRTALPSTGQKQSEETVRWEKS